jgi:autotransporter passenger strand-loop-strand repeat protein
MTSETISSGISGTGLTVSAGIDALSAVTVLSGGTLDASKVMSGGAITLSAGAAAALITVSEGGLVTDYGSMTNVGVYNSVTGSAIVFGSMTVASGGTVNGLLVFGPGVGTIGNPLVTVAHGGTVVSATVNATGNYDALAVNGLLSASTLLSGNTHILSGGLASRITVDQAGLEIYAGGSATSVTINKAGHEEIYGGSVDSTTITSGGVQILSGGAASNTVVSSGGALNVSAGGIVYAAKISAGGSETIQGNGTAGSAIGSAIGSGSIVLSGGKETLLSGGIEIGGAIAAGASEIVGPGAAVSNTTISGGTLTLSAGALATGAITFAGGGGTLVLDGTAAPAATISGFTTSSDAILLAGHTFAAGGTVSVSGDIVTITDHGSAYTLDIAAGTGTPDYVLVNDGGLVELMPCYAGGTRILTPSGEVCVENLLPGDRVITARPGGPQTRPVIWTGHRRVDIERQPDPEYLYPVRIVAGAFAPGIPARDLRLSPHHAVYIDGHLFEALSLVNGDTVFQETGTKRVTYYHIELDEHDIMLAEGLPAESYLNTGNRHSFAAGQGATPLDFLATNDDGFCVPMIRDGKHLEAARTMLRARAKTFRRPIVMPRAAFTVIH